MAITTEDILFHSFALIAVISSILVVFMESPIYSALFLALTMSVLGAFFFMLHAPFVAVAQVTVYAGAVMVLFIMVVMLFDLNKEHEDIFKFSPVTVAKLVGVALLCGFLMGVGWLGSGASKDNPATVLSTQLRRADLSKLKEEVKVEAPPTAAEVQNPDEDLTAAEANNLVDKKEAAPQTPPVVVTKDAKPEEFGSTVSLSQKLFTKYVFAFEVVSLLLLVAIVGSVALARSKGGTHAVGR